MVTYKWAITTTDANSQSIQTSGEVTATNFDEALRLARESSFNQITSGRAVYGMPGVTCTGPYRIIRLALVMLPAQIKRPGAK